MLQYSILSILSTDTLNIETFKSKLRIFITIIYYAGSLMERKTLNL